MIQVQSILLRTYNGEDKSVKSLREKRNSDMITAMLINIDRSIFDFVNDESSITRNSFITSFDST